MTANLNNFAGHFKFRPTDVSTYGLVFSFVYWGTFKNWADEPLLRNINLWSIGLRFFRKWFVNDFVFGSIPPKFEEA